MEMNSSGFFYPKQQYRKYIVFFPFNPATINSYVFIINNVIVVFNNPYVVVPNSLNRIWPKQNGF